jgi:hypothetical protein
MKVVDILTVGNVEADKKMYVGSAISTDDFFYIHWHGLERNG